MAAKLYNLARMVATTTGTGTMTLDSAVLGHLTFEDAGISDGDVVSYGIFDGASSEVGRGVYDSSAKTLTRSVLKSTNSDSAIDLSGSAQVFITALAEDFDSYRNLAINPCGQNLQAGLASTSDGGYTGFDQWLALTQSAAVTPSQLTDVANGIATMMRMNQDSASAQRMGWLQPIESKFVRHLRGRKATLQFVARVSAATTLRYAIVEWTGTKDSITKGIVDDWTDTTFTPGNFFKSSNLTIAASGSKALSANTLTTIGISGDISASMNNVLLFVWTDSAQAQNVTLDLGNVWFGLGASAPAIFEPPAPDDDLRRCLRYLQLIKPGTTLPVGFGYVPGGTSPRIMVPICVAMRATPSASLVGGTGITGTQCLSGSGASATNPSAMSVNSADSAHVWFVLTVTGMVSGELTNWAWAGGSAGSLVLDARL